MQMVSQVCSRCRVEKSASEFNKANKKPSGLQRYCKACASEMKRQWSAQNKDRVTAYNVAYYHDDAEKHRARVRDYYVEHADERREYRKQYYQAIPVQVRREINKNRYRLHADYFKANARRWRREHPERVRERLKNWQENNREATRAANKRRVMRLSQLPNTLTNEQREFARNYFGGACAVCGRVASDDVMIILDHWIPVSYTGDNPGTVITNCVPLCHGLDGCNNKKHNRLPRDWFSADFSPDIAAQILARIDQYFAVASEKWS